MRIGKNKHSYFNGNIGYYIEEPYCRNGYAYYAVQMLFPLSLAHLQDTLFIACGENNIPSIKTILRLGGKYLETILPPKEYIYYYEGMPRQNIYLIT